MNIQLAARVVPYRNQLGVFLDFILPKLDLAAKILHVTVIVFLCKWIEPVNARACQIKVLTTVGLLHF